MPTAAFNRITDYFPGVTASPAMTDKQFYAVYMPSDTQVTLPDGSASENPIGILHNEPGSSQTAQVAYVAGDISKALCSVTTCTITRFDPLWVDTSARVIRQATSGCPSFARSLVTTTASGVIPILLTGITRITTASDRS